MERFKSQVAAIGQYILSKSYVFQFDVLAPLETSVLKRLSNYTFIEVEAG